MSKTADDDTKESYNTITYSKFIESRLKSWSNRNVTIQTNNKTKYDSNFIDNFVEKVYIYRSKLKKSSSFVSFASVV